MFMDRNYRKAFFFFVITLTALTCVWAQELPGLRVRADDGDLWHLADNPAVSAFSLMPFRMGIAYATVDAVGSPTEFDLETGTWSFAAATSLLHYQYFKAPGAETHRLGGALSADRSFALGYAYAWGSGVEGDGVSQLGLVSRPFDFLSLGITVDAVETDPLWGVGIGFRPLFFAPDLTSLLTLTADAHWEGDEFLMESVGVRLALLEMLDIRGWYDFQNRYFGIELVFSFGPSAAHASLSSLANADRVTLGHSVGIMPPGKPLPFEGNRVLVIKDIDVVTHGPEDGVSILDFFSTERRMGFQELLDMIDRATADGGIVALAIEDLPPLGSYASIQEFAQALFRFRNAGKKVYLYSGDFFYSPQFQIMASVADYIAVSPTGMVNMTGFYARGVYLKGFLDRIGVRVLNVATGKTKSAGNIFSETGMPEEVRAMLTRFGGDLQSQALDAFAAGRGDRLTLPPDEILAHGPYFSAAQAREDGIIDFLQYREEFETWVKEKTGNAAFIESYPAAPDSSWGPSLITAKVAVVHLSGNIIPDRGLPGISIGDSTVSLLKELKDDPLTAGVLLRIDSPGGSARVSDEIAHQVRELKAAGKPVIVSMGDIAASGGYYIAADSTRIFAEPGTITGSIGVVLLQFNLARTLALLDITTDPVRLTESSGTLDPLSEFRDRDIKMVEAYVNQMYDKFISVVAAGRRMDPARVRELARGQIWTGREALENGLVDELGDLQAAKAFVRRELGGRVEFRDYWPGALSGMSRIFGGGAAAFLSETFAASRPASLATLEAALEPFARVLAGILEMGSGPLYYSPEAAAHTTDGAGHDALDND